MNEFDALLARAVEQARALGIPVSARISPRVAVNRPAGCSDPVRLLHPAGRGVCD